ncbi:hypothetical protein SEA_SALETE_65 [Streptomyces phage Salete]|uniref:Uncharacterized protein n=2 Tax=Woodruffvirus TP1604 TaxID=1982746 RepID=A0A2U8UWE3_9CAUD|nr:hypothetical protein SEA_BAYC_65 [Streptomyces phage BayC]AWN08495.1 hypothetical protein SEA_SALETE_65 [Streptomyces phage Salete]USH45441.1 hypothetical protein SEA_ASIS_66 [Streptomyces phage Asis]
MAEFKNNTDVFAPSNTGTKAHAFLGSRGAKDGNLRAACRVTIQRSISATFISLDRARKFYSVCDTCVKLFLAAEDRAEASMQPATEAHDFGYVAPVDERTETEPADAAPQCTCECTWKCDRPADEPCTCPCICGVAPTEKPQNADLSTEDGTVTLNGDTLTRRGHWADVTLAGGRTYSVSMKVHRKSHDAASGSRVLVDHVIYWRETDGRSTGPIRTAGETDLTRTVGGRIWALLLAANIA